MPISAYEVWFVLLDVFGDRLATLSKAQIKDFDTTAKMSLSEPMPGTRAGADWNANWSEIRRLLTVVSFVAKVRTQDGVVWQYDDRALAESLLEIGLAPATVDALIVRPALTDAERLKQ